MANDNKPANENIIRRIQLLMQMANRPEGNEAEATNALALAQKLLAAHNLEMAMVLGTHVEGGTVAAPEEKREKTKISRSAQYKWQREMWKALAEANFCWHSIIEVYEGKRGKGKASRIPVKRHMILGRESNVIAVRLMGEYLEDTMERLLTTVGGFTNQERLSRAAISWKSGCAERLIERIQEQAEARKRESDAAPETGCTGLVLRDVYQREYEANYDARYGQGAFQRKQIRDAEWEAGQAEREAKAKAEQEQAEREWLEYLQNETPQQKKARERQEEKDRIKQARANRRFWNRLYNEQEREAAKVDHEAVERGRRAGNDINLSTQISSQRKDRSLS